MINRTAVLISAALFLVMLAAGLWRISLLPDWTQLPAFGPNGTPRAPVSSLLVFTGPACVLAAGCVLAIKRLLTKGSPEAVQQWKQWGSSFLIVYAVICTVLQLSVVARSAGMAVALNPQDFARAGFVLLGIMLVVMANRIPKLPWLQSRLARRGLDQVHGEKLIRFGGQLNVLIGLTVVIGGLVMPVPMMAPLIFSMTIVGFVAAALRRFQWHREQAREHVDTTR